MTILAEKAHITAEEFTSRPHQRNYELINGQLVERKPMGMRESHIAARIVTFLSNHVDQHQLGYVFASDLSYRCFGDPDTLRRPDVSFISNQRLPHGIPEGGYAALPPDLAVEVVSPNDLAYEVQSKVELYLAAAIPVVWVVYPNTKNPSSRRSHECPAGA